MEKIINEENLLYSVTNFQEDTFDRAKFDEQKRNFLRNPKKVTEVSFPVRLRNHEIRLFKGYRVLHSDLLGPGKGGIRFSPYVNIDEIIGLAAIMTWKNALHQLPFGGAKGGVIVNVKELEKWELENLTRSFTRAIADQIGIDKDIPAPDMYTDEQVMAWIVDEYSRISGKFEPGVVTGKPISLYGIPGRREATGYGAGYVFEYFIKKHINKPKDKIKIAVQGFGNVGYYFSRYISESGYKIVGISDSSGAIYSEKGINVENLYKYKKGGKYIKDYSSEEQLNLVYNNEEYKIIENEELLEMNVDVLVLAATENQITKRNADNIKAEMILEIANGPVTYSADNILKERNKIIIPDILANGGGVVVSYYEWLQNRSWERWSRHKTLQRLENHMINISKKVCFYAQKNDLSYRESAYDIALRLLWNIARYRI